MVLDDRMIRVIAEDCLPTVVVDVYVEESHTHTVLAPKRQAWNHKTHESLLSAYSSLCRWQENIRTTRESNSASIN